MVQFGTMEHLLAVLFVISMPLKCPLSVNGTAQLFDWHPVRKLKGKGTENTQFERMHVALQICYLSILFEIERVMAWGTIAVKGKKKYKKEK